MRNVSGRALFQRGLRWAVVLGVSLALSACGLKLHLLGDKSGNSIPSKTVAPLVSITSSPGNPSSSASASFDFSATNVSSGGVTFQCQLDGGGYSACTSSKAYS